MSERVTFFTRATYYVVLAERTAMTLAALRPPFLVHAYTSAAAFDAHILVFPVLAERTAIAVLAILPPFLVLAYTRAAAIDAIIPHFLVLAYTRAAAFDALRLLFPVLAFHANPGLCHGCTDTRPQLGTSRPAVKKSFFYCEF